LAPQDLQAADTRQRLLEAACDVFASKSYRDATIAEICEKAGANIAAVNYYFRDKASLYVEAWRLAFDRSQATHPADGGVPPDAPPEDRLRGHIRAIMQRIADPRSLEFDIVHQDMMNPTGLLQDAHRQSIEPIQKEMAALVAELLGPRAEEQHVRLCKLSIMGQCFHAMRERHRRRREQAGQKPPFGPAEPLDLEAYKEHVVRFSLAGIADVRRRIEAGQHPQKGAEA